MKLKFRMAWETYRVGDVIEPNAMLRNWLIANRYCVPEGIQTREPEKPVLSLRRGRPPNKAA